MVHQATYNLNIVLKNPLPVLPIGTGYSCNLACKHQPSIDVLNFLYIATASMSQVLEKFIRKLIIGVHEVVVPSSMMSFNVGRVGIGATLEWLMLRYVDDDSRQDMS